MLDFITLYAHHAQDDPSLCSWHACQCQRDVASYKLKCNCACKALRSVAAGLVHATLCSPLGQYLPQLLFIAFPCLSISGGSPGVLIVKHSLTCIRKAHV